MAHAISFEIGGSGHIVGGEGGEPQNRWELEANLDDWLLEDGSGKWQLEG